MTELNSPESWDIARKITSLLGSIPSSFTTCIRFLMLDSKQGEGKVSKKAQYNLLRLLNSDSLRSPLQFAAFTYKSEEVQTLGGSLDSISAIDLTPQSLIDLFKAEDLAGIIALVYLYRQVKRGVNREQWNSIAEPMRLRCDYGGMVGQAIPNIGIAGGILSAGIGYLANAMFLGISEKEYVKLRRNLKQRNLTFSPEDETLIWGCSHTQIASMMLQSTGLGVDYSQAVCSPLHSLELSDSLPPEFFKYRVSCLWVESLQKTGQPPDMAHKGHLYPKANALDRLLKGISEIKGTGSPHNWLEKGKDDLKKIDELADEEVAPS